MNETRARSGKSIPLAYLLWFFLGYLGAHRFYLGRTVSAAFQLSLFIAFALLILVFVGVLLAPLVVLWWLIDAALIPFMARPLRDPSADEAFR